MNENDQEQYRNRSSKRAMGLLIAVFALLAAAVVGCLILSVSMHHRLAALEKDIRNHGSSIEAIQNDSDAIASRIEALETTAAEP